MTAQAESKARKQETRSALFHEFHETGHSDAFYFMKEDSKRCCDTTTPESIHTKDESKRGSTFAFIFVWIDQYNECNRMTSVMKFMCSVKLIASLEALV